MASSIFIIHISNQVFFPSRLKHFPRIRPNTSDKIRVRHSQPVEGIFVPGDSCVLNTLSETLEYMKKASTLDTYVSHLTKPSRFVYGGGGPRVLNVFLICMKMKSKSYSRRFKVGGSWNALAGWL